MAVKKNILIVGGAGYVGGSITDLLMNDPRYQLKVYDNLLYEESYRKPVDFVYGDILEKDKLKPLLDWADAVLWLGAIVGDGACKLDEVLTVRVNQESVKWLAENYKKRIVFTSTCSVYGAQNDVLLTETSPIKPLSLYAYTKIKAEEFLVNSNAIIFRLGTLFGVSDAFSRLRMDLVANLMTVRAHTTKKVSVFGGGQYRPLLHVRDAAHNIAAAIEFPDRTTAEIYNISALNIKILELAEAIKQHFPDLSIETSQMPFEDTRNYQVSCEKAIQAYGFQPRFSLNDGIQQLAEILHHRRIKDFHDPRYSNQLFLRDIVN